METLQRQSADHDSTQNLERVTDSARIAWILTQLMEKRELLTISVETSQEKFTSTIIKVNVKTGQACLDELMPRTGNKLMIKKCRIQVAGRIDGINVDFNMIITEAGNKDGMVYFAAGLPKSVNYQQRRDTHRVRMPMIPDFHVTLVSQDNIVEEGLLRDLSHGGAQVILKSESKVVPMSMLYECAIELPAGTWVYCTVDVRYVMPFGIHSDNRVGIRFLDLTPFQQRAINQCVLSVELEYIRKHAL